MRDELNAAGLTMLYEGDMSAEEIDEKGCIDRHYASIAKSATETDPSSLALGDDKKGEFKSKFGQTWEESLELGLVFNAKGAAEKLGTMDGEDLVPMPGKALDALWAKAGDARVKLAPGLYVSNIGEDEPLYVINGFYMAMREKYCVAGGNGIHFFVVAFDPEVTSWAKFRGEIIGATDPTAAPEGSIRGKMLASWEGEEGLDLDNAPNVGDNGVHASAGPIEGLKERVVWLAIEAEDDPFGEQLIKWTGGQKATILPWLEDAEVEEQKHYEVKGKMFDLTEDKDTNFCLQLCNNIALA